MDVAIEFGVNPRWDEVVVPNDLRSAKQPESLILRRLSDLNYSEDVTFAIKLALEEALTNAIKHGNRNDTSKQLVVKFHIDPQRALIVVRDEGPGFSPQEVPDPTADENLERPSGRGIMLMQAYMTKVRYNDRGNEVWMLKENQTSTP
jgi:serine/threonine-protein kinase RsbW